MIITHEKPSSVTVSIRYCARCGGNHADLTFTPFTHPIQDADTTEWTHWAMCPELQEPILLQFVPETKYSK